jgi:hypothetical protein
MQPVDPAAAAAIRQALGLRPGDPAPDDLAAAAQALNDATAATVLDGGSMLLLCVALVRQVAAGGCTANAARAALAAAWPITRQAELADLAAVRWCWPPPPRPTPTWSA